ncbi:MAG: GNAT family N-acetyltransferase [Proteobacteria bacterium]|nr:GNAT family N-acetyltransferase [Pseudomonadota bacterium]
MIRKYNTKDVDAVVSSWRLASELAHPFLTPAFLDQEADNIRNVYMAFAKTWVTEVDDRVVGFIALVENEIGGLFQDPAYHGQGLGRAMLDMAVADNGALTVEVFKKNVIGRRFYESYGFQTHEEFIHETSGQETIRMSYTPR